MRPYFAFGLLLMLTAMDSPAPAQTLIRFTSGTGFYVGRQNDILTNSHVVRNCEDITVSGPSLPIAHAERIAYDDHIDLALLRATSPAGDIARLNSGKQPMQINDPVILAGYPGMSWQTGDAVIRQANILALHGPMGEEKWLQFSDSLQQGNSGGPLLDSAGNVAGVVVAKAVLTTRYMDSGREETTRSDIAIALPVVRQFLAQQHVYYEEADSGIYLSADRVADKANQFIVHIKCRIADGE